MGRKGGREKGKSPRRGDSGRANGNGSYVVCRGAVARRGGVLGKVDTGECPVFAGSGIAIVHFTLVFFFLVCSQLIIDNVGVNSDYCSMAYLMPHWILVFPAVWREWSSVGGRLCAGRIDYVIVDGCTNKHYMSHCCNGGGLTCCTAFIDFCVCHSLLKLYLHSYIRAGMCANHCPAARV